MDHTYGKGVGETQNEARLLRDLSWSVLHDPSRSVKDNKVDLEIFRKEENSEAAPGHFHQIVQNTAPRTFTKLIHSPQTHENHKVAYTVHK